MFNVFKKKEDEVNIYAPVKGEFVTLENVPDPIFSEKLMGEGFAVIPYDNVICAPCSGKLSMIADTLHAFGITMKDGSELLVHIGLDTVGLKGKYFRALKKAGEDVKHGEPVILVDVDEIKKTLNPITMVIMTNNDSYTTLDNKIKVNTSNIMMSLKD
ncbi:PTS glucose transporter subunit IIA [Longibaculum muris]|uniref:PTS sugar transporter subunit IIA n=1 Tax=Longibaculum muris TaxID=1796628 RepID=UPI0012B96D32|nr:PTS glucose transporter subunit IIA [Longibaculum muris]